MESKNELLGKELEDKITGFKGIATSTHIYLTGCNQFRLQPKIDKDGKVPDTKYFDEGRPKIIGEGINAIDLIGEENGCDFREHP